MTTEARRQFYLGIAGVQMWYARAPLPGAAPSPAFDFREPLVDSGLPAEDRTAPGVRGQGVPKGGSTLPVSDRPSGATSAPRPSQRQPVHSPAPGRRLTGLMDSAPASDKPQVASPPHSPSIPAAEPVNDEQPEASPGQTPAAPPSALLNSLPNPLNLGVWLGQRFALISEWTDDASGRLQTSLAGNILKSLGESEVGFHGTFSWPVFANVKVAGRDSALLVDVLRRFFEPVGARQVLWLGSQGDSGSAWLDDTLGQPPRLRFNRSLAALAGDPALKRELWRVLKPLAPR